MPSSISVFWCSCAADSIRKGLALATYHRWMQEKGVIVYTLTPEVIGCNLVQFQGLRRKWAEEHAQGPYILAEDDCMPLGKDFALRGMATLLAHPEYAVLGAKLMPFPPPMVDEPVSEGITAGGINFTRNGLIDTSEIPLDRVWDECAQAEHLRKKGWKSGWMRDVMCNHLGAFHSTLWPEPYTGVTSINNG